MLNLFCYEESGNKYTPPYYTVVRVLRYILIFSSLTALASCATGNSIPAYFADRESVYPSDKYISAEGSGNSPEEARESALTQISLYFDTSVQTSRSLIADYQETEINGFYSSRESRSIQEKAEIKSEAQFFCVQFTSTIKSGKEYYIVAFIDREQAYRTFKEKIDVNTIILENLLPIAGDVKNPFNSIPAGKNGKAIADMTLGLIKNIQVVSEKSGDDYSNAKQLASLMQKAYREIWDNADISVHVVGDWNNTVRNTLSELVEQHGFTVSHSDDASVLYAEIESNRSKNAAGIFLTPSIVIKAKTPDGKTVFSYTKKFEREGAPEDYEDVAWRKSFSKIESDLRDSFASDFSKRFGTGAAR